MKNKDLDNSTPDADAMIMQYIVNLFVRIFRRNSYTL